MQILVIGGTKFMGPHVVRRLATAGQGHALPPGADEGQRENPPAQEAPGTFDFVNEDQLIKER